MELIQVGVTVRSMLTDKVDKLLPLASRSQAKL
jgi:hypothetical protein